MNLSLEAAIKIDDSISAQGNPEAVLDFSDTKYRQPCLSEGDVTPEPYRKNESSTAVQSPMSHDVEESYASESGAHINALSEAVAAGQEQPNNEDQAEREVDDILGNSDEAGLSRGRDLEHQK